MKTEEEKRKTKKGKKRTQALPLFFSLLSLSPLFFLETKTKNMASSPPRDTVNEATARAEKRNESHHSVPKGAR